MVALKMGEVFLESIPQLATQWLAVFAKVLNFDRSGMDSIQVASVLTSTFTIVYSLVRFVGTHRRKYFISHRYPTAASLFPLFLFLLTGIGAATTQFRFTLGSYHNASISFWILNATNFLLSVLLLFFPGRRRRIVFSFFHFLGMTSIIVLFIFGDYSEYVENFEYSFSYDYIDYEYDYWYDFGYDSSFRAQMDAYHIVNLTLLCCTVNLVLGALILPSVNLAPRLFAPMIYVIFGSLRMVILNVCPVKWRQDVNELFDEWLAIEEKGEICPEVVKDARKKSLVGKALNVPENIPRLQSFVPITIDTVDLSVFSNI